jgi:isoleucyl-tRNA synthetase
VTRYAQQTGHHVERRFGWDCHGLPVEYEIDKKLGVCVLFDLIQCFFFCVWFSPLSNLFTDAHVCLTNQITGPQDVLKMGIDKYNAECRAIVMRYSGVCVLDMLVHQQTLLEITSPVDAFCNHFFLVFDRNGRRL